MRIPVPAAHLFHHAGRAWAVGAATLAIVASVSTFAVAQPSVATRAIPEANGNGWHNAPPVVEFRCRQTISCPEPVEISDRVRAQPITRSAFGEDGSRATASIVVSLDSEAPSVRLEPPPASTSNGVWLLKATVSDALSGVASATCNGRPVVIESGTVTCDIPLVPGLNDLIVQAMDRAGNSGSAGATIARLGTPTHLAIVPGQMTLLAGEQKALQVVDEFGRAYVDAVLTSSDPGVVEVVDRGTIAGRSAGTVTVAATWRTLRADMSLTVAAGDRLELDTVTWSVPPEPGSKIIDTIYTHGSAGIETLLLEQRPSGNIVARALASAGQSPVQSWIQAPALRPGEAIAQSMGETFGGGLLIVRGEDGARRAMVRVGRPDLDRTPLWRFETEGRIEEGVSQGWNGTIFALETPASGFTRLLVIDGRTGTVRARVPIPRSRRAPVRCHGVAWPHETAATVGRPFIPDGQEVAVEFAVVEDDQSALDCAGGARTSTLRLAVLHVNEEGVARTTDLATYAVDAGQRLPSQTLAGVVPDGRGGLLAPWTVTRPDGSVRHTIVRIDGDRRSEYALPLLGEITIIDGSQPAYVQSGGTLGAFDPESGQLLWQQHVSYGPVRILAGRVGGGIIARGDGGWIVIDEAGTRVAPGPPPSRFGAGLP